MKKINKHIGLFSSMLAISGIILFLIIKKFSPLLGHAAYYCQSLFTDSNMTHIPYFFTIIPIALVVTILTGSIIKFLTLSIKAKILQHKLISRVTINKKVLKIIVDLGIANETIVIKSTDKFAFCLGIRRPKIYISTGLITLLSTKELEAVLRHEQYHLISRDTITQIIVSVTSTLFPFFPLIGDLKRKYKIEREIAADKFSVAKIKERQSLVSALRKLLAFPTIEAATTVRIADQDTIEPRIYSLVNKTYSSNSTFSIKHFLITLLSSILLAIVFVFPVHAREIHHESHDVMMICSYGACMNSCISQKNLNKLYLEIPSSSSSQIENSSHTFTPAQ